MAGTIGKVSSGNVRSAEVTVWGLRSLDGALKDLAPDLRRDLYKALGSQSKVVANEAKARTALAFAGFSAGSPIGSALNDATAGIKLNKGAGSRKVKDSKTGETITKRSGGRAALFGFRIKQSHGFGALAEFARQGHTPQGRALVSTLASKFGSYSGGRFLWSAMDARRDEVNSAISLAVKDIERELQNRIDALGVGDR